MGQEEKFEGIGSAQLNKANQMPEMSVRSHEHMEPVTTWSWPWVLRVSQQDARHSHGPNHMVTCADWTPPVCRGLGTWAVPRSPLLPPTPQAGSCKSAAYLETRTKETCTQGPLA